jgi:hypothetical protein
MESSELSFVSYRVPWERAHISLTQNQALSWKESFLEEIVASKAAILLFLNIVRET